MSDLSQTTDAVARGLARLPQQFRETEKLKALVEVLLQHFQDAEDALWGLQTLRWLDTATGAQLTELGELVGEPRAHTDDDVYRLWVKARILVNRSNGKPEELLHILALLEPDATTDINEYYPAFYLLTVLAPAADPAELAAIMREAKPAGVGTGLVYSDLPASEVFTLSDDDTVMAGDPSRGLASDDGTSSGGHLTGLI
jgi:hypothetical protein